MDQNCLIEFEQGIDDFMADIKACLIAQEHAHICHCSMPQCLHSLRVVGHNDDEWVLRLVLLGCGQKVTLARLSWLDRQGRDHVCCYLNDRFEAVKRKLNGKWVLDKHSPRDLCLQQWSHLHSSIM